MPVGGQLGSSYAWMCVLKSEGHGVFFQLQGSEMSENISLKLGVNFAASHNMGKTLCLGLYIMSYNQHKLYENNQKIMDCR